jgi:hypothetical protein
LNSDFLGTLEFFPLYVARAEYMFSPMKRRTSALGSILRADRKDRKGEARFINKKGTCSQMFEDIKAFCLSHF